MKTLTRKTNKISRRELIAGAAAISGIPSFALAGSHSIKLGSLLDLSGPFEAYGDPMYDATQLAVNEINAAGGLLGRQVEVVGFDTQSDIALYTNYVQQLVRGSDKVDVVHGGILSASREAIRGTLHKNEILYFYNVLYEGGVCDRNMFATGITPSQQAEVLVPHVVNEWGKKMYILAADYNYGQNLAGWVKRFCEKSGGSVVQTDYFPLDVVDFNATITKIQDVKPDIVMSILVGGAHLSFYRQWAATGMKERIPMTSTTLGVGLEHVVLTPEEGNGIVVAYNYAKNRASKANDAFRSAWRDAYGNDDGIHEIAVSHYQGIKLWAEGVKKAGSLERGAVIAALEKGLSIDGPAGKLVVDPQTHHVTLDVHIMEVRNQQLKVIESFSQLKPTDTQSVCNLKQNPDDNTQYQISI